MDYNPQNFAVLFASTMGQKLWKFLNKEEIIRDMKTATYLGRPAVEALSPFLLKEFGDEVRKNRTKQMIGHMARHIMEGKEYVVDRKGVRITRQDNMFSSATRYRKENQGPPAP